MNVIAAQLKQKTLKCAVEKTEIDWHCAHRPKLGQHEAPLSLSKHRANRTARVYIICRGRSDSDRFVTLMTVCQICLMCGPHSIINIFQCRRRESNVSEVETSRRWLKCSAILFSTINSHMLNFPQKYLFHRLNDWNKNDFTLTCGSNIFLLSPAATGCLEQLFFMKPLSFYTNAFKEEKKAGVSILICIFLCKFSSSADVSALNQTSCIS